MSQTRIILFTGKGGVGKSFVLSSVGMSLAKKGKVVMVIRQVSGLPS